MGLLLFNKNKTIFLFKQNFIHQKNLEMFKFDKIKNLFDCSLCNSLLVDPVSLPCGFNVCKQHIDQQLTNNPEERSTFKCEKCQDEHHIPKRGFVVNSQIQNALSIELSNIKITPVFDQCKKEINEARENVVKIESLDKKFRVLHLRIF